jgi:hypothetical protein
MEGKCIKYNSNGDKEYEGEMKNDFIMIIKMVVNMMASLEMVNKMVKVFFVV